MPLIDVYKFEDTIIVRVHKAEHKMFEAMVARACNTWPDAPVAIKEFHDTLIHGEILQDYECQSHFIRREELAPSENMKLDSWGTENKEPGT